MKPILLALLAVATPAVAQAPDWSKAEVISVTMTNHGFIPRSIPLRQGARYVLRIANRSDKGHNLTQKAFFDQSRVAPQDQRKTDDGQIVLAAGERTTVRFAAPLTRRGGTYEFASTVLGDADEDYKGVFIIR